MRDWQIAWAAGFLDGEGCFQAHRRKNTERYALSISASQARDRSPLDRLQAMFGGCVCEINALRPTQRRAWKWSVDGASAVLPVLDAVTPYLANKRREAETLYRIALLMPGRGKQRDLTDADRAERHRLAADLREIRRAPCPA